MDGWMDACALTNGKYTYASLSVDTQVDVSLLRTVCTLFTGSLSYSQAAFQACFMRFLLIITGAVEYVM